MLVGHEELTGQLALQAGEGVVGLGGGRFRQQDDEFFATVTRQNILRAQVLPHHAGEVDERFVPDLVAEIVVESLEVVDVEQRDRERAATSLRAC